MKAALAPQREDAAECLGGAQGAEEDRIGGEGLTDSGQHGADTGWSLEPHQHGEIDSQRADRKDQDRSQQAERETGEQASQQSGGGLQFDAHSDEIPTPPGTRTIRMLSVRREIVTGHRMTRPASGNPTLGMRGRRADERSAALPYRFALLHPTEHTPAEAAHNRRLLGPRTLGIEVTEPVLAARCGLGNIDPQHDGGDTGGPAILACLEWRRLPPAGSWLVTIRPDLDALGGMALIALRRSGVHLSAVLRRRVAEVARADGFEHGPWPGPRPLPRMTAERLTELGGGALGPAAAVAADHAIPLECRVELVARWLDTGEMPRRYRQAAEARGRILAAALAGGALRVSTTAQGRIAVVEGSADGAVRIGYLRAPVVVALNPEFSFRHGPPHRKFTVCQYRPGYVDLAAAARTLAGREPGWGGSATIIGSPQGRSSELTIADVAAVVLANLR